MKAEKVQAEGSHMQRYGGMKVQCQWGGEGSVRDGMGGNGTEKPKCAWF